MKPSEALFKAADYISVHGHYKHKALGPRGEACLTGALRNVTESVTGGNGLLSNAEWLVISGVINAELGIDSAEQHFGSAVSWNDEPQTTAEDVILTLKRAGKKLADAGN